MRTFRQYCEAVAAGEKPVHEGPLSWLKSKLGFGQPSARQKMAANYDLGNFGEPEQKPSIGVSPGFNPAPPPGPVDTRIPSNPFPFSKGRPATPSKSVAKMWDDKLGREREMTPAEVAAKEAEIGVRKRRSLMDLGSSQADRDAFDARNADKAAETEKYYGDREAAAAGFRDKMSKMGNTYDTEFAPSRWGAPADVISAAKEKEAKIRRVQDAMGASLTAVNPEVLKMMGATPEEWQTVASGGSIVPSADKSGDGVDHRDSLDRLRKRTNQSFPGTAAWGKKAGAADDEALLRQVMRDKKAGMFGQKGPDPRDNW